MVCLWIFLAFVRRRTSPSQMATRAMMTCHWPSGSKTRQASKAVQSLQQAVPYDLHELW